MKSIETLARVDALCVDKTGTITEPSMCVKEIHAFSGEYAHTAGQYSRFDEAEQSTRFHETELEALLADYVRASKDNNATMQALKHIWRRILEKMTMLSIIKYRYRK